MTLQARVPATPPAATGAPALAVRRKPWQRGLYMALAIASLALAVVGVFIPGLPSTVFVLLASWAAARSSPRLHRWLHEHKTFGPMLHQWHNGRRVARRAKVLASVSMSACMVFMLYTIPHPWVVWSLCGIMVCVLIWIWRRPEPESAASTEAPAWSPRREQA